MNEYELADVTNKPKSLIQRPHEFKMGISEWIIATLLSIFLVNFDSLETH